MARKIRLTMGIIAICLAILATTVAGCSSPSQEIEEPSVSQPTEELSIPTQAPEAPSREDENIEFQSYVIVDVYKPVNGRMVLTYHDESHNVITNIGLAAIARHLGGQTAAFQWTSAMGGNDLFYRSTAPTYIALSSDSTGVDAANSSWQAVDGSYPSDIEIVGGGLDRGTGTLTIGVAYTAGSGGTKGSHTYSLAKTFTVATGSSFTAVQKAGLFNNVYNTNNGSTSTLQISALIAENTFTAVNLSAGDQIAITWRITL